MDNAVTSWQKGGLVVLPTETVYGLAADATNGEAVARIYALKSRPQFNPLIVHVTDATMAKRYVQWNAWADALAEKFWPGPLTLVLTRVPGSPLSDLVSAGGETVAVRAPAHPVAQQLIQSFGGGLAAPSANRSGRVSPTTAQHVRDEFGEDAPLIIDGGPCAMGVESTVVDISGETPLLLRPGSITREMLLTVLPSLARPEKAGETLKSPGMLESHYAPGLPVRLNAADVRASEALLAFGPHPLSGAAATRNLSEKGDLLEAAAHLFASLRALDDPRYSAIAVMPIPSHGVGEAMNDRLRRAAAPRG